MKFAIIAAGEGSRLMSEGIKAPKPLVVVNGETLVERLIRIFNENGAEEIVVIVNYIYPQTAQYLRKLKAEGRTGNLTIVVKTTPSSMHSFYEISSHLAGDEFCLTTVDTIFDEKEFADYIEKFKACKLDGMMAVTDYVDDEKPFYVSTNPDMDITAFNDTYVGDKYISGGIYCLKPSSIAVLDECIKTGKSRMRNFQRSLIDHGLKLKACPFSKILDIDHATDIAKAVSFLKQHGNG